MKALVDPEVCIGCELCTQTCPDVFKMQGDKAVAYTDPVPDTASQACKQAAEDCPVEAIKIEQ
jgi:ferredoxin